MNGDFENFTLNGTASTTSYQLGVNGNTSYTGAVLTGWGNYGYGFVFTPSSPADTGGAYTPQFGGTTQIWGPGGGVNAADYSNNGLTTSPTGGNYVVEDGGYSPGILYQTLTGLTVGATYNLTFNWAAAQQYGFSGATTEGWTVYWADANNNVTASYVTPTDQTASHGFTPWKQAAYSFVATTTTDSLAFLAAGTPSGQPPFSLIDSVSLTAAPEPSSWAILVLGLVALPVMGRLRAKRRLIAA